MEPKNKDKAVAQDDVAELQNDCDPEDDRFNWHSADGLTITQPEDDDEDNE